MEPRDIIRVDYPPKYAHEDGSIEYDEVHIPVYSSVGLSLVALMQEVANRILQAVERLAIENQ